MFFHYADGEHACGKWLLLSDTSRRGTDACTTARNNLCKGNMMFCDIMLLVALLFASTRLLGFSVCILQASSN